MASSTVLFPKQGKHLLKDFLLHDYHANGFSSFPRKASKTISAFQAMINIVKNIRFSTAIKSPSMLPRNLSRKLSKKNSQLEGEMRPTTVRVKDIMRWKSFRDLVDEELQPSDFASSSSFSDHNSTTTGSTSTPCGSNGSSWGDSDFTSEYSPSQPMETKTEVAEANAATGHKGGNHASEEKEQHSPLSVLGFGHEEDSFSSFNQSHASTERTKHKHFQSVGKWMSLEEYEERALQLLNHVKETSSLTSCDLVLDLFRQEVNHTGDTEFEDEMVGVAKAWINGDQSETAKCGFGDKREAYVREMDREGRWGKFVEERQELAWEIECGLINILADELLVDLLV